MFLKGAGLKPLPPNPSKNGDARSIDLCEGEERDGKRMAAWMKQAAKVPGWKP